MNRFATAFLSVVGIIVIATVIVVGMVCTQAYRFWFQDAPDGTESVSFAVESGSSLSQIADALKTDDIIASPFWFKVYTVVGGHAKDIQAGEFSLIPGEDYATITEALLDAQETEVSITIPEGYTVAQIGAVVMQKFDITQEEWNEAVGVSSPVLKTSFFLNQVKPSGVDLEGYLFPDTYRFFPDATAEDIVSTMVQTMSDHLGAAISSRDDSALSADFTPNEVLTLASIVQREVQDTNDMAMVADIFLKRLDAGMPLQADSTVNYVTGGDSPSIALEDRDVDSLYNTYKYPGLPPGPISNPGIDALEAVLNPTPNDYYYFLTTTDGEVIYAKTHDEHVQNKARYLY